MTNSTIARLQSLLSGKGYETLRFNNALLVITVATAEVIRPAIHRVHASTRKICRDFESSLGLTPRTRLPAHTADCHCNDASRS